MHGDRERAKRSSCPRIFIFETSAANSALRHHHGLLEAAPVYPMLFACLECGAGMDFCGSRMARPADKTNAVHKDACGLARLIAVG
jgi:hypothetical protein